MTAPASTPPAETSTAPATGEDALGDAGKLALNAERTAKREAERALAAAQARIVEFENAGRTEAEKLAARTADLAARELAIVRHEVAVAKGVPAEFAARLAGSTKAELEADAESLMKLIPAPAATPAAPGGSAPVESLAPPKAPTSGGEVALNNDPLLKAIVAKVGPPRV